MVQGTQKPTRLGELFVAIYNIPQYSSASQSWEYFEYINIFLSAILLLYPLLPHLVDSVINYFLFCDIHIYWL